MLRLMPNVMTIAAPLVVGGNTIVLTGEDAGRVNACLSPGDHVYLSLLDQRGIETMRYTHNVALAPVNGRVVINVDRAQHDTVRRTWPHGARLHVALTEGVLREFICQSIGSC